MTKTLDFNFFGRAPRMADEEKAYFHKLTSGTVTVTFACLLVWALCLVAII